MGCHGHTSIYQQNLVHQSGTTTEDYGPGAVGGTANGCGPIPVAADASDCGIVGVGSYARKPPMTIITVKTATSTLTERDNFLGPSVASSVGSSPNRL